ncbi:MAG: YbaN family protein [Clostridia bacterium]|nr:YbaN family protein [Clostridia bacterium]
MSIKRIVFIVLGCICLALGAVGIFLPVLPTTPFFLATLFFFTNSSKRLHDWFIGTGLYNKHLDSFVKKRGMTLSTKLSVILTVTLLMGFGFFMMARKGIWIPCIILSVVWLIHLIYFIFRVKTIPKEHEEPEQESE